MSRGPGRIERAIRALFDANPDDAFTTDNLCAHCYGFEYAFEIERKHRVATVRAAHTAVERDPDWCVRWADALGRELIWYNQASLASTALADALRAFAANPPHRGARKVTHSHVHAYGPRRRAREAAQLMLDPPPDLGAELRCAAKSDLERAKAHVADHLARRAAGDVRPRRAKGISIVRSLGNTYRTQAQGIADRVRFARIMDMHRELAIALAAQARRLITENDPDAIRAGLAQIADALDAITAPATPV